MKYKGAGVVHDNGTIDYLYRLGVRAFIQNEKGEILVVDEWNNGSWSLPGGGLDYDESPADCLKRELAEETGYTGTFSFEIAALEDPQWNQYRGAMQANLIYRVTLNNASGLKTNDDNNRIKFASYEEIIANTANPRLINSVLSVIAKSSPKDALSTNDIDAAGTLVA